jgi:hypothetical protein
MIQEIKPTYVTFEQAKWLKEKGLVANCKRYWVKYTNTEYKEMSDVELDNLDREIGIGGNLIIPKYEQHQVVEWLRINHGIWVSVNIAMDDKWYFELYNLKVKRNAEIIIEDENVTDFHNSTKEAYSAAFDYIKDNDLI